MSYAAAAAVGVGVLGYMTAQQNRDAQSSANAANRQMSAEEIAMRDRQFEYGTVAAGERETNRRAREAELNQQIQGRFDALRGENIGRYDPYTQAGSSASKQQAALLGLGTPEEQEAAMSGFGESPGQRFIRERAQKALLRNQAAIGGLGGGNVRTALVEQGAGFAAQDYGNYFNRLGSLADRGKSSADSITGMGTGPAYLTTGQDLGVASTKYKSRAAPPPTARPAGRVPTRRRPYDLNLQGETEVQRAR